ncbi:hypothetical protein B9T23_02335 [Acinetobacter terrae]|uniref:hypothetical protein n=1 Tax=Acinetobacter terrae TaxID=2731247 RepID=UPI000A34438A|nr:hypothetical protein [Acinetobacter terrae]OTG78925.1 hypothetical protein B9T23_02335 [Acinetobacter terrae]
MHYSTKNQRNLNNSIPFVKQAGISSLLFILLVGLSLTVLTVGYMSSMRNLQSSATTAHAQTQAQMKAMMGYHALSKFLLNQPQGYLDKITAGDISEGTTITSSYVKSISCPASTIPGEVHYCFDITGKSGGASAIIRAMYAYQKEVQQSTVAGTIFAGGLVVGGNANFVGETGENVTIFVGGENAGKVVDTSGEEVTLERITVQAYTNPIEVADAGTLKNYANYLFTKNNAGSIECYRNNLHITGGAVITTPIQITCPTGVSIDNKGVWSFNSSTINLPGIMWFEGSVLIQLQKTPNDMVNTVLATGSVTTDLGTGNIAGTYNAYAPLHYLLMASDSNIKTRLDKVCPAENYPVQYCQPYDATQRSLITSVTYFKNNKDKFLKNTNLFPANLSNILFLTDTEFAIDAANDTTLNLYGNLVGTKGAGGTGKASGKITGTGDINIKGNLVVTGDLKTEVQGNMTVTLGKSNTDGNNIPVLIYSTKSKSIRYM